MYMVINDVMLNCTNCNKYDYSNYSAIYLNYNFTICHTHQYSYCRNKNRNVPQLNIMFKHDFHDAYMQLIYIAAMMK